MLVVVLVVSDYLVLFMYGVYVLSYVLSLMSLDLLSARAA